MVRGHMHACDDQHVDKHELCMGEIRTTHTHTRHFYIQAAAGNTNVVHIRATDGGLAHHDSNLAHGAVGNPSTHSKPRDHVPIAHGGGGDHHREPSLCVAGAASVQHGHQGSGGSSQPVCEDGLSDPPTPLCEGASSEWLGAQDSPGTDVQEFSGPALFLSNLIVPKDVAPFEIAKLFSTMLQGGHGCE